MTKTQKTKTTQEKINELNELKEKTAEQIFELEMEHATRDL